MPRSVAQTLHLQYISDAVRHKLHQAVIHKQEITPRVQLITVRAVMLMQRKVRWSTGSFTCTVQQSVTCTITCTVSPSNRLFVNPLRSTKSHLQSFYCFTCARQLLRNYLCTPTSNRVNSIHQIQRQSDKWIPFINRVNLPKNCHGPSVSIILMETRWLPPPYSSCSILDPLSTQTFTAV